MNFEGNGRVKLSSCQMREENPYWGWNRKKSKVKRDNMRKAGTVQYCCGSNLSSGSQTTVGKTEEGHQIVCLSWQTHRRGNTCCATRCKFRNQSGFGPLSSQTWGLQRLSSAVQPEQEWSALFDWELDVQYSPSLQGWPHLAARRFGLESRQGSAVGTQGEGAQRGLETWQTERGRQRQQKIREKTDGDM